MFHSLIRAGSRTARPVRISGVALTSVSVNPNPLGRGNQYLKFTDSSPLGTDVKKFLTGYDVAAEMTAQSGLITNSRYGLPFLFQNARTMRLGVRFIF